MIIEIYLEDVCLDLIVRKHVYNCVFKAADQWSHTGTCRCENMYSIYGREYRDEKKQEWQKSPAGTRQTDGKNWGLVWRNRKKMSQIIKDYFYLPFFLLIILWGEHSNEVNDFNSVSSSVLLNLNYFYRIRFRFLTS